MLNGVCCNCFQNTGASSAVCPYCGYDPREKDRHPLALPCGTALGGRYILGRVLGQGGFGITYVAQDHKTKKRVAVKEYFPDTVAARVGGRTVSACSGEKEENFLYGRARFLEEAKTLAEFAGEPNIVRVYSYFEENDTAYFVMELVDGISFQQYIEERGGKIGWEDAFRVLAPVMDALASVHTRGIVHRDVKPENIFLASDGAVKLLDFGSARYSLGEKSRSLDVLLTHGFAPWEQYSRHSKQGAYTDVYSLAATFYYAVTGCVPPDSVDRVNKDTLVPLSRSDAGIPARIGSAVQRALAVYPKDRFQDMNGFRQALGEEPGKKEDHGRRGETDRTWPRRASDSTAGGGVKWLLAAAAILGIAAAAFAWYRAAEGEERDPLPDPAVSAFAPVEADMSKSTGRPEPQEDQSQSKDDSQAALPEDKTGYQYTVVEGRDPGITISGTRDLNGQDQNDN